MKTEMLEEMCGVHSHRSANIKHRNVSGESNMKKTRPAMSRESDARTDVLQFVPPCYHVGFKPSMSNV